MLRRYFLGSRVLTFHRQATETVSVMEEVAEIQFVLHLLTQIQSRVRVLRSLGKFLKSVFFYGNLKIVRIWIF